MNEVVLYIATVSGYQTLPIVCVNACGCELQYYVPLHVDPDLQYRNLSPHGSDYEDYCLIS